jgi:phospholipid transport system substrate-binding protein
LTSENVKTPNSIVSFLAGGTVLLALLIAHPGLAAAGQPDARAAEKFAQTLENGSLKFVTDKSIPRATRAVRVRALFQHDFDLQAMGRFAMGSYWKAASDEQRLEYMDLFEKALVSQYTVRLEDFAGMIVKPLAVTPVGEHDFIVSREARHTDGMVVGYEWRVRAQDGGFKVVDLTVMNISMCATERGEFAEIIQRGGGGIDALLYSLRKRSGTKLAQNN